MTTTSEARGGTIAARLGRAWQAVRWYVNGVTGQSKFDCYLEHERRTHPDREPMSEREFWRQHYRSQDNNPGTRCC